ncbi:MAG TPA: hypothetical protein VEP28_04770 [Rubrobacter sp.]|jgi:hypothetical protein|nr:hypothetical protein [Rubrobacter sp.]
MKAVWSEEFGGTEALVAVDVAGQRGCGTDYERTHKDDEDNRC